MQNQFGGIWFDYVKSSFILVNFITRDDKIDCYAGQVQYFFKHIVDFENGPVEHNLAYVRWYKPNEETCNVEL